MPTYGSSTAWATNGGMSNTPPPRGGNVVIPGSDELPMELLEQMFGIGVGPEDAKRKMRMREGMSTGANSTRGDLGDYMGSKRKAYYGEGQPPANYKSAEKRLNDMLKMTGGYINGQRNLGDLWRYYHGFA